MSELDERCGGMLLRIARSAIELHLRGTAEELAGADEAELAGERRGVFVTIRKFGRLRGCIGTFAPQAGLPSLAREMAVAAAHDPRFVDFPMSVSELRDVRIELSILSPLRRIEDPLDFEIGLHGIYVRSGEEVGCFLPSVAVEQGWDRETFLSRCCGEKAGLASDAWRRPGAEVSTFTVQKFEESPRG